MADPEKNSVDTHKEKSEQRSVFGFIPTMKRLMRSKSALFGLVIVVILVLTAIFAPLIAPHDIAMQYKDANKVPPLTTIDQSLIDAEFENITKGTFQHARWSFLLLSADSTVSCKG